MDPFLLFLVPRRFQSDLLSLHALTWIFCAYPPLPKTILSSCNLSFLPYQLRYSSTDPYLFLPTRPRFFLSSFFSFLGGIGPTTIIYAVSFPAFAAMIATNVPSNFLCSLMCAEILACTHFWEFTQN